MANKKKKEENSGCATVIAYVIVFILAIKIIQAIVSNKTVILVLAILLGVALVAVIINAIVQTNKRSETSQYKQSSNTSVPAVVTAPSPKRDYDIARMSNRQKIERLTELSNDTHIYVNSLQNATSAGEFVFAAEELKRIVDEIADFDGKVRLPDRTQDLLEPQRNYLVAQKDFQWYLRNAIERQKDAAIRNMAEYTNSKEHKEREYKTFCFDIQSVSYFLSDETKEFADNAADEIYQATGLHFPMIDLFPSGYELPYADFEGIDNKESVSNERLIPKAVAVILETRQATVSMLQRRLGIGYIQAAQLIDQLEKIGIVGPAQGSLSREILVTEHQWRDMRFAPSVSIDFDGIISDKEEWRREQRKMSPTEYELYKIDQMEGHDFEAYCADLLQKNGFAKVSVTQGSGDQGVDVLAEKGGIKYAVQCKCYSKDLSNTPIQEVHTGKDFYGCHVGAVMTNRYFTPGAKEAAKRTNTLLWDRDELIKMLEEST